MKTTRKYGGEGGTQARLGSVRKLVTKLSTTGYKRNGLYRLQINVLYSAGAVEYKGGSSTLNAAGKVHFVLMKTRLLAARNDSLKPAVAGQPIQHGRQHIIR